MDPTPAIIWELVLRGVAIGALFTIAAGIWRSGSASTRIAGLLLTMTAAAYALNSSPTIHPVLGFADIPVHLLALGGAGCFWLFIVTVFEDRPVTAWMLAPTALLTALGFVGWQGRLAMGHPVWISHNLIEAGFAVHALFVIVQSWRGDLVEARRRLRGPVLGTVTLYVIALSAFEIGEGLGVSRDWYAVAGAFAIALASTIGGAAFMRAEPSLFGATTAATAAPADGLDAGDRLLLTKLEALMAEGQAWKREGLAIGALAEEVGAPEHKLRRLINDHLGFRNFAAFVNARRIDAAKAQLADPAKAREPVSAIAFDLGFGSLGPFNRAFKEATGQTPTEWRRQKLAETENP